MSWEVVEMRSFLSERKGRFKPNDKAIMGLKRIEKIDFSGNIYLSEKASKTDMILIKQGDLVISGINVEKGAMSIYKGEEDVVATIHYSSYEYNLGKIDLNFLRHFLKSSEFLEALKEQVPGGIKTEIKPKHILPLKVCIPTNVKEQREVVEYLDKQNNTIETQSTELTHQLDLVKQLRQSFLREAMEGQLVPQDPKDEPASVLLEKIKAEKERLIKERKIKKQKPLPPITEEEIPFNIPENWVWCRLGEVTINHDGSRVPLSKYERSLMQGEFDYYGAMDVIDHINDYKFDGTYLLIAEDGQNLLRKNKPVAFLAHGKFWVNNHAHVSDCYHDITRIVVGNYINTIDLTPHISGKPPSQIKLKRSALDLIPFPLPPLSEQQRIVAKLDELMQYSVALEASIKESQQQNELLLQQVLREALEPKEKEVEKV